MLRLPNNTFDSSDLKRLADWAELACLCRSPAELSDGDIADELHGSLLFESGDPAETHWERVSRIAQEILLELRSRQLVLKHEYPFDVSSIALAAKAHRTEYLCYTTLLAADLGRFYKGTRSLTNANTRFTTLFEKLVRGCLEAKFGGTAIRFGWPIEDGWPTGVTERIDVLARAFGVEAVNTKSETEPTDKDIGLDVAARISLGDEGPGTGVFLVQCATGQAWQAKSDEPYMKQWQSLIRWESHLIQAVAFPWRRDNTTRFRQLTRRFPGIVFDRLRLLCGRDPDACLDAETYIGIHDWCEARLSEFVT